MHRTLPRSLLAVLAFHLALLPPGSPPWSALASLLGASLLALAVSAHLDALVVTSGALAGLLLAATQRLAPALPWSPALAGALLLTAASAERTARLPGAPRRAAHLALCGLAGAGAAALLARHGASTPIAQGASLLLVGVLLALPRLLPAEDPTAHLLDLAATALPGPTAEALRGAAELRRWVLRAPIAPRRPERARWHHLRQLVHQRLALAPSLRRDLPPGYRDLPGSPAAPDLPLHQLDGQLADACLALRQMHGLDP
jgi:hypothetical protein